ncbi:MAG: sialidase [Acidobacteria bacterium]|nr:sialidase [Acidobacteriota bacterium]
MRKLLLVLVSLLLIGAGLVAQGPTARPGPDLYSRLRWRYIGPEGNRTDAVAGVPGDPLVYYVGAASGGIWKTTDGGIHWEPIFDDQPVSSIGALAVAPSDANIIWAGTGEPFIRSHISVGEGIFRSTDAGKTWTRAGLEKTGRIARVLVHPIDPNVVLACALGHAYGPQPERGVFRTIDGGKNWERVLFVDENTGCSDLAMDPKNPRILFAGMWQIEIHTWGRESGGPGSGLFTSRDGGTTWTRLTGRGLPAKPVGKVAVAIARTNPNRVYTLIETGDGVPLSGKETDKGQIWRTEDGGVTWRMINTDRNAMGRAHYYSRMAVATDNENETYYLTASYSKSIDAGQTLTQPAGLESPGGDNHDMWIDPTNADRLAVANDAGVSISVNRGRTWNHVRLPIAQLYHVTVDNQVPYYVYGNKQDGPSYRGPSNSRLDEGSGRGGRGGIIPRAMWHTVGGGESGFATPDPVDSNIVWSSASGAGSVGGIVTRYEENRRLLRDVEVWPDDSNGIAADLKYRFVWNAPLAISPHDRNKIYVGSQHVHQTTDGGQSWQEISPDLTLNDKSRQQSSGGLTPDNIGVEYAGVVMSIAESPKQAGLIWAGTNDGLVQVTRDGGKTWTNVTKNIPSLPPWGTVGNVEPSRFDAGTAYITVDFHQVNNRDPFVYKTTDFGGSWKAITNGIPHTMLSYAHCVREDPVKRGLLYLGTENGAYVSFDDGENWQPLQMNLPHAPVYWLVVQEQFNDLVIATYGRGFWILDDVTPLRDLTPQVLNADAQLFPPRPAYRFRAITGEAGGGEDPTVGINPPYGAAINYYLKTAATGNVALTISDAKGQVVLRIDSPRTAGLNRVYWDLRDASEKRIAFRTSPIYAEEIPLGPDGTREGAAVFAILQPPGTYTVKLSIGGRDYTQPLVVRKDPHSAGTEADIEAQQRMLVELRRDLDNVVDAVNNTELVRGQIRNLRNMIQDTELKRAADELDQKLTAAEGALVELRSTGRGQDGVRWGSKLVQKFGYLANGLAGGDFKPTNQQLAVQKELEDRLKGSRGQLGDVLSRDLTAFNDMLRRANLPTVTTQTQRRQ